MGKGVESGFRQVAVQKNEPTWFRRNKLILYKNADF
jgi:hypothetical protein